MAMEASAIKELIIKNIPDAEVRIEDLRGDGEHYAAYVTSASFEGKSRVAQHRMVYDALEGKMTVELHALAVQTFTPDQTKEN